MTGPNRPPRPGMRWGSARLRVPLLVVLCWLASVTPALATILDEPESLTEGSDAVVRVHFDVRIQDQRHAPPGPAEVGEVFFQINGTDPGPGPRGGRGGGPELVERDLAYFDTKAEADKIRQSALRKFPEATVFDVIERKEQNLTKAAEAPPARPPAAPAAPPAPPLPLPAPPPEAA